MSPVHHEPAFAKLTRTLRIVGRREDGYHLLESEMLSLDLADDLEISDGEGLEILDEIDFAVAGKRPTVLSEVPLDGSNLVSRALALTTRRHHVLLHKRIPPGAGLGGGSSDAAAILRFAGFDDARSAASLGADVPFCIRGGRAFVRGIGEIIEPLDYEERHFVLLVPPFGVSTVAVYRCFDTLAPDKQHGDGPNDLEAAALLVEPRLETFRSLLFQATGHEPVLAGSGSSYFVECNADERDDLALSTQALVVRDDLNAVVARARSVPAFS